MKLHMVGNNANKVAVVWMTLDDTITQQQFDVGRPICR